MRLLVAVHCSALAQAPAWPVKPVHIVVSLTPGSATDIPAERTEADRQPPPEFLMREIGAISLSPEELMG